MSVLSGPLRPPRTLEGAARRTRARRAAALAGMLTAIGGLVGLRAALVRPPTQALGTSGLATRVGSHHDAKGPPASQQRRPRPRSRRVTVIGNPFDVGYGIVQVKVRFNASHITDVSALSLPQGGRSSDISSYAGPQLRREALAAQSARIDTVSGASYTSSGYARSLQSALDKHRR